MTRGIFVEEFLQSFTNAPFLCVRMVLVSLISRNLIGGNDL